VLEAADGQGTQTEIKAPRTFTARSTRPAVSRAAIRPPGSSCCPTQRAAASVECSALPRPARHGLAVRQGAPASPLSPRLCTSSVRAAPPVAPTLWHRSPAGHRLDHHVCLSLVPTWACFSTTAQLPPSLVRRTVRWKETSAEPDEYAEGTESLTSRPGNRRIRPASPDRPTAGAS